MTKSERQAKAELERLYEAERRAKVQSKSAAVAAREKAAIAALREEQRLEKAAKRQRKEAERVARELEATRVMADMSPKPRILTFDIETSPIEAYVWGLWDQNVPIDFIKVDWSIFAWAAKWLDKPKVMYQCTGGRGKSKVRDDRHLLKGIIDLLDEADIVIAQNGRRFDVKKVNARAIQLGYAPPSPYRVVDTMLAAKRYFAFTSQKLKWTSELLTDTPKDDHKKFPGFELWKGCLADDPAAWAEMKKYNIRDVQSTEKVYLKLRPWIENHPNVGVYDSESRPACPKCGGHNVKEARASVKQQGVYRRYQCSDCGGWSRGKVMQLPLEKRRSLLVPE